MSWDSDILKIRKRIGDIILIISDSFLLILIVLACLSFSFIHWDVFGPIIEVGYFSSLLSLFLGLLGLSLHGTTLFQQKVFKLLIYLAAIAFIITFSYSISMSILIKYKGSQPVISTPITL